MINLNEVLPMTESSGWQEEIVFSRLVQANQSAHLCRFSKGGDDLGDAKIDPDSGIDVLWGTTALGLASAEIPRVDYHRVFWTNRQTPRRQARLLAERYLSIDVDLMTSAPLMINVEAPWAAGNGDLSFNRDWLTEFLEHLADEGLVNIGLILNAYLWRNWWNLPLGHLDYGQMYYVNTPENGWFRDGRMWDEQLSKIVEEADVTLDQVPGFSPTPAWWQFTGQADGPTFGFASERCPLNVINRDVFNYWFE